MVGILVRAPAPALRRVVQAGVRIVTAQRGAEATEAGESAAVVREGERLGRGGELETRGMEALAGGRDVSEGMWGRSEGEARTLDREVARRLARRDLLVGRLRATRVGGAEARGERVAAGSGVGVAERRQAEVHHPRPLSRATQTSRGERGAKAETTECAARRGFEGQWDSPAEGAGARARAGAELVVKAVRRGGGVRETGRDGWRGGRRGESEAEEDLRLELVR